MDGTKKIVVVLSDKKDFYLLSTFEAIPGFRWEIATPGKAEDLNDIKSSVPIKLYEHIPEMPGYLRGLTDDLSQADLILAVNPISLSCFQALRASRKWKKPFGLISNLSFLPMLSDSCQEVAMMREIFEHSSFVLTMHRGGKELLELEGAKNVELVRPQFIRGAGFCMKKRQKFRSYINVTDNEFLILSFIGEDELAGREVMLAFKMLMQKIPEWGTATKVLISYRGDMPNLRYFASDLGISRQILLLNQNSGGFFQDLSSAADAVFDANSQSQKEYIPTAVEAITFGATGIYHVGTILSEHMPEDAIPLKSFSFQDIAIGFQKAFSLRNQRLKMRMTQNDTSDFSGDILKIARILNCSIKGSLMTGKTSDMDLYDKWQLVAACKEVRKYKEAISVVHEIININQSEDQLSQAYFELGSLHFSCGDLEMAIDHLGRSVQFDNENWKAYLTLAKVSLISHSEEDAVAFYKRVLALKPHQPEALAGIGMVYRMLGMPEDAIYWLNSSLTVNPTNEKVLLELTQACLECEQIKEPIRVLEQFQLLMGDLPCIIMALGQLHLKDGNWEQGKAMVAKALESERVAKPLTVLR